MLRKMPSTIGGLAALVFASAPQSAEHLVEARPSLTFSPDDLTIAQGDIVHFENAGGFHNVREVESDSGTMAVPDGFCAPSPGCAPSASAWSSAVTFDQPGIYYYLCEVHGTAMRGKISVLPDVSAPQIFVNGFEGS